LRRISRRRGPEDNLDQVEQNRRRVRQSAVAVDRGAMGSSVGGVARRGQQRRWSGGGDLMLDAWSGEAARGEVPAVVGLAGVVKQRRRADGAAWRKGGVPARSGMGSRKTQGEQVVGQRRRG